jgi:hypothetical protein
LARAQPEAMSVMGAADERRVAIGPIVAAWR